MIAHEVLPQLPLNATHGAGDQLLDAQLAALLPPGHAEGGVLARVGVQVDDEQVVALERLAVTPLAQRPEDHLEAREGRRLPRIRRGRLHEGDVGVLAQRHPEQGAQDPLIGHALGDDANPFHLNLHH